MDLLKQLFFPDSLPEQDTLSGRYIDLILDWFNQSGLAVSAFEEDFHRPLLAAWQRDEYGYGYMRQRLEQAHLRPVYHQLAAILYLTHQTRDTGFMHQLFDELFAPYRGPSEERAIIYESIRAPHPLFRCLPEGSALRSAVNGSLLLLSAYHAFCLEKDQNISTVSSTGTFILYKKEELVPSDWAGYLRFIAHLPSSATTHALLRTGLDNPSYIQQSVERHNQAYTLLLNIEACLAFSQFLSFFEDPDFRKIDWQGRSKVKVTDLKSFAPFMAYAQKNREAVVTVVGYFLQFEYTGNDLKSIWRSLLAELVKGVRPDRNWLTHFFKSLALRTIPPFSIQHLLVPLMEAVADQLAYEDELVRHYEHIVFSFSSSSQLTGYPESIQVLSSVAERMDNPARKALFLQRLGQCRVAFGSFNPLYHRLIRDEKNKKHPYFQELIDALSRIMPVALTSVERANYYNGEFTPIFQLNVNGQRLSVSSVSEDINRLLKEHRTGYRLVIIPISETSSPAWCSGDERQFIGSLAFMAHSDYRYFIDSYLTVRFPGLLTHSYYAQFDFDQQEALPFYQLREQARQAPKSPGNRFLTDRNWNWFRESYIDQLSSKEAWYNLMDFLIQTPSAKKPSTNWLAEATGHVDRFGRDRFFSELRVLLAESSQEKFWYFDTYPNTLKSFIWLSVHYATESSLQLVRLIIERAYTKISGVGPQSTAMGNLGLSALAHSGKLAAFGVLSLMKTKSRYNRFTTQIDKAMTLFMAASSLEEEALADQSIPGHEFAADGTKWIDVDGYALKLSLSERKLAKTWYDPIGRKLTGAPKDVAKARLREISEETKQISALLEDMQKRLRTYWLNDRHWKAADWRTYLYEHPLIHGLLQKTIWRNQTQQLDFLVHQAGFVDQTGKPVLLADEDVLQYWHPVLAGSAVIRQWQHVLWQGALSQPERQAFREYYPFSAMEAEQTSTNRFAGHFLHVSKLMAIANKAGWSFTYVHEGSSWPRRYYKALNVTVHLVCAYDRADTYIPTQELVVTRGNTVNLDASLRNWERIAFKDVPAMALSEFCRDIDLFISATSVGNDAERAMNRIDISTYQQHYQEGFFSEHASARVRRHILKYLLPALGIKQVTFEGNYAVFDGQLNRYKINLGSGFAQLSHTGKHLNLLPIQLAKLGSRVRLPIEDDPTLLVIIAKLRYLLNDGLIDDEAVRAQLT